jgi:hypothetical protein
MAPTLLGAHARFTCEDCGYQFESNYSTRNEDDNAPAEVPAREFPTTACPNCGNLVHVPPREGGNPVQIHFGDRILVLKYLYLLNEPQRWDVVVFKSPDKPLGGDSDPDAPAPPGRTWYTTNFIKRLVGRPGETLMVLDGDNYVREPNSPDAPFKVQSKPNHVQNALWRIVCDGDFLPHLDRKPENRWTPPWRVESGSGWDVGTPGKPQRVYTFDALHGSGTIAFDQSYNNGHALTDFLAYAQAESGRNNVSDVKLSFLYDRKAGDGPLRLRLAKLDDTFTAELSRGGAKLYRKRGQPVNDADLGDVIASAEHVKPLSLSPIRVEFSNVDYGVRLRVGDSEVLHASYEPDIPALMDAYYSGRRQPKPEIRIVATDQTSTLSHVSIWRDVYYTNDPNGAIRWARPDDPVHLGRDEYFVMGDNTVISADARYWPTPIHLPAEDLNVKAGRVPARFMLGKAFFVYWPAGYRPFGSSSLPSIVPNFGDMRLIH